ncbi:hypothetical protein [Eupransor demetentiae]|uniref:Uncharacterized protein n=1 Tax=Eupransor demetentiae TaxID=3109584 RepID=A0ABP0ESE5_9LACO|nr:hypothetical protein R54876_GBNLAHCA_00699 [Lactobacillaceae bacterium LMG 33000]
MAEVTFKTQPELNDEELDALDTLHECGIGETIAEAYMADGYSDQVDFEKVALAYFIGYE